MKILAFKPGHDGAVALVDDGRLIFSLESEKDSFPRYSDVTPTVVAEAMKHCDDIPDVLCISGWVKGFHSADRVLDAGYFGWTDERTLVGESKIFGRTVTTFSSTHERSHLMSGYGLAPFPIDEPCYGLVWEGNIGSFYEYGPGGDVRLIDNVMADPGNKYQYVFSLADPTTTTEHGGFRYSNAGKLMALTAFGDPNATTAEENELIEFVLAQDDILRTLRKSDLSSSKFFNIGVESPEFTSLAASHSQRIFDRFHAVAEKRLTKGYPLIVSGGCGLNCDWNTRWRTSGLFADVFVPPITNDSGSAVGTAIDAQRHLTGRSKVEWSVYCGPEFCYDVPRIGDPFEFVASGLDGLAEDLKDNSIVAWAQGCCEIGPRALGNRSLLASAARADMQERLNQIKGREDYRPIAPVCREEDVSRYFDWTGPSPHMLYFQRVSNPGELPAVTHVDGSARAQTVTEAENPRLYELLGKMEEHTGVGVLCNTSLNFPGRGFINRTSDLIEYVLDRQLDGFVLDGAYYRVRAERR